MADDQNKQSHSPLSGQAAQVAGRIGGQEGEPISSSRRSEVGGASVEVAPIREQAMSPEVSEYIQQQETSIKLDDALKSVGATKGHDEVIDSVDGPQLLMNDQQIAAGLKQPLNSSMRWLATLMLYVLEQSHYTLRTVKGHVQRVFKP